MFLIAPLGKEFSEILIDIHTFSFKKMHLKISYGKWRPFCTGLKVKASCITQHSWHQSIQTNAVSRNFTALCWIYTTVLTSLGEAISWFIWFNDSNIMTDDLYEGTFRYIPLCGNSQVPRSPIHSPPLHTRYQVSWVFVQSANKASPERWTSIPSGAGKSSQSESIGTKWHCSR